MARPSCSWVCEVASCGCGTAFTGRTALYGRQLGGLPDLYPTEPPVFFDCRNDAYGDEVVEDYVRIMTAMPGWDSILNKYSLSVAFVPKASAISTALSESREWKLAYQDSVAVVFTKSVE